MPIAIYGIKNCDTMKKARAWLARRRMGVDTTLYACNLSSVIGRSRTRFPVA